jgi:hypothetical protein
MASAQVDASTGKPYLVPFPATEGEPFAPSGVIGTLATAHGAAAVVLDDFLATEKQLAADILLSSEGKAAKAREVIVELEGRFAKFQPHLQAAEKKLAEQRAALQRAASKPYDPARGLALAGWLRDVKPAERPRVLARALELNDLETLTAAIHAPAVWEIFPNQQWRERAERALLEGHDAKAVAELDRLATAIQAVKETHSTARAWVRKRAGIEVNADLKPKPKETKEKNNG